MFPWSIKYPNVNDEIQNLDWILSDVKRYEKLVKDFIGANIIKYADPIAWDISREYEANTVVIDPGTGDAYISVRPVPHGYDLTHIEYWTKIFNYGTPVDTIVSQIATNEGNSVTASQNFPVGALLFINGILYEVISPITAGDTFDASNVQVTTVEEHYDKEIADIRETHALIIGDSFCVAGVQQQLTAIFGFDEYYYYGNTGAGYVRHNPAGDPYGDYTFEGLATLAHTNMGTTKASEIDYVIIYGGINDSGNDITVSDVATASLSCFNTVKSLYPNAKVVVACNGGKLALNVDYQTKILNILANAMSTGCIALNDIEHTLYQMTNIVDSDNIHPTPNGCRVIAYAIYNALMGNNAFNRIYHYDATGNYTGHVTAYTDGSVVNVTLDLTCVNAANDTGITLTERNIPGFVVACACGNNVGGTFFHITTAGKIYIFGTTAPSTRYAATLTYPLGVSNS